MKRATERRASHALEGSSPKPLEFRFSRARVWIEMIVRRSGGSSSPSRVKKQRLRHGAAAFCFPWIRTKLSLLRRMACLKKRETWTSEDEDGEDSALIFQVGDDDDDVWETKTFSRWGKQNWACFYYNIDDYFFQFPKDYFKPGEDPRSRRRLYELKMGHSLMCLSLPFSEDVSRDSSYGARLAIEFFNRENKMGRTLNFESLSKVSVGSRHYQPYGRVYFITFVATETDSGLEREFQASFFRPYIRENIFYLRALREKPYVF